MVKRASQKIYLVFENCEVVELNSEGVDIYLDGFKAYYYQGGELYEGFRHVAITIDKDKANPKALDPDFGNTPWERIVHPNDITHIEVDGHYYSVPWKDEDESGWSNAYQHTKLSPPNRLEIIISPTRKSLDEFT